MVFFYRTLLIALGSFLVLLPVLGQQNNTKLITGDFQNVKFEQFVREIEANSTYRFYYDPALMDTIKVNLQVQGKPLPVVLEQALKPINFTFAIDQENQVYITKGRAIELNLPANFFTPGQAGAVIAQNNVINTNTAEPERPRTRSTSELKLYEIGNSRSANGSGKATIAGHLRDIKSGEAVIGASIYIEAPLIGGTSDQFGYYSLTLPVGRHEVKIKGVGIKNTRRQIMLHSDGKLEIEVEEDITNLKEVVIEAEKDKNVAGMQMGLEKLDIKTLKQVPTAFGETDILRVILTLPGVKSVGEGSTGMNVRGGATDQNLILFNDATIYNPSHLFGFFSAFNPDVLKTVELYKSAIPAKYGGRLSSVLEISTRDGNKKQFAGSGGIGLLTSRLTLEGPIVKDKTSFIIGGRTTYSDWILKQLPNSTLRQSEASFYDVNAHITHEINDKNTIYATGYQSQDKFKLGTDTAFQYMNRNASLKWKHIFNNKLYGVLTGAHSIFNYNITSDKHESTASKLTYGINQSNVQADFNFFLNPTHTIDFGASTILYQVSPGSQTPLGSKSLIAPNILSNEKGQESALYISDLINISPRIAVQLGVRYSMYKALGPKDVFEYTSGLSRNESSIIDTTHYKNGEVMATYHGPEYRASIKYILTDNSSVKASFNRMRQYIHMLSNTASMSPTDIWKLSDRYIRPQIGDQYAIGYYRNLRSNTIETSVETYYKSMRDFVDYKNGATLILNHHIETDVINAEGKAYGVELMVKKLTGKINGWASYTYSRTLVRVNTALASDMVNDGKYYPSNFDKPHDFTLIGNYRFSRRFSTSLNATYSTGRPITLPLAKYEIGGAQRVYYSQRNEYRVPDYFRMDFAMNIEGNHKVRKLSHSSWSLSVYNLTGRKNPYSVYFKTENGKINGYKLSIFGQPIPTVTYNFKF
ncbi:TonB-dependent receptor [Adhaeribacter aquaticus]|uniref:TonB-dependent receptor n=1 Tax=Adhaeribacter aquaticus TaxID=299567 RepID=UPI00047BD63B|nr:carboxypeptidase-like regulatory domain-containing protein [Adhaeribacter aquaticus]